MPMVYLFRFKYLGWRPNFDDDTSEYRGRRATRERIAALGADVVEESGLEVPQSQIDSEGMMIPLQPAGPAPASVEKSSLWVSQDRCGIQYD